MYSVTDQDTITLLDTLDLDPDAGTFFNYGLQPRVDLQTGRIYIPCCRHGVCVVMYDGNKLVPVATLKCVKHATSLAVVSTDTLFVCDIDSNTVCVVDVNQDRVTDRLQKLWSTTPDCIAVLGDTVLAGMDDTLYIYRHGISTPEKLTNLPVPWDVPAVSTDHHSSFLVVDYIMDRVYVLGVNGNHIHTISLPGDSYPVDCTVVGEQLWVGCRNGGIIVMSSHKHSEHLSVE